EERLKPVLNAEFAEVFLALADAKKLEAEYFLREKKSPLPAIQNGIEQFEKAFKINASEQLIPLGRAELEILRADWMVSQRQSPEPALTSAASFADKTLQLNPRSADAFMVNAE